jgi:hypothetical protein
LKISFGVGIITTIIGLLIGLFLKDWLLTVKVCGYIGGGCFALICLINGVFISGDRSRGNYLSETENDRKEKGQMTKYLLTMSVPNIIVAILIFVAMGK